MMMIRGPFVIQPKHGRKARAATAPTGLMIILMLLLLLLTMMRMAVRLEYGRLKVAKWIVRGWERHVESAHVADAKVGYAKSVGIGTRRGRVRRERGDLELLDGRMVIRTDQCAVAVAIPTPVHTMGQPTPTTRPRSPGHGQTRQARRHIPRPPTGPRTHRASLP